MKDWNGGNLRKFRKARGLTEAEVAEAIGISPTTLGRYETGKAMPRADVLLNIAVVLQWKDVRELAGYPCGYRQSA